jgi:hypothetical protein
MGCQHFQQANHFFVIRLLARHGNPPATAFVGAMRLNDVHQSVSCDGRQPGIKPLMILRIERRNSLKSDDVGLLDDILGGHASLHVRWQFAGHLRDEPFVMTEQELAERNLVPGDRFGGKLQVVVCRLVQRHVLPLRCKKSRRLEAPPVQYNTSGAVSPAVLYVEMNVA